MAEVLFGRLNDLPLREAWAHEAYEFTPWLSENIDHLSETIGVPLELTGTEVRVEAFAADILARNPQDGSIVLIENQLEGTDHTHLGQIMTYLAGLGAQTVVWIAPSFREPHLSAIRWLNEHTAEGFSFFAVKLRVVRIGDSPYAPIFEIVEKPNDWSRAISRKAENAQSAASEWRKNFWQTYLERHPEAAKQGISINGSSFKNMEVVPGRLQLGRAIWKGGVSVYLRGPNNQDVEEVSKFLEPIKSEIINELKAEFWDGGGWHALISHPCDMETQEAWPEAADFLHQKAQIYLKFLEEKFSDLKA